MWRLNLKALTRYQDWADGHDQAVRAGQPEALLATCSEGAAGNYRIAK